MGCGEYYGVQFGGSAEFALSLTRNMLVAILGRSVHNGTYTWHVPKSATIAV